jgi:hypothetical protein
MEFPVVGEGLRRHLVNLHARCRSNASNAWATVYAVSAFRLRSHEWVKLRMAS